MIRLICALLVLCGASVAFADQELDSTTTYITGRGSYSGFCDGNPGSYFCIDQIRQYAQRDAISDAQWTCQMKQGTANTIGATCSDFCTPNYIPPNSGQQYVSCRSDCSIRCEIQSRNIEIQE